MRFGLGTFPLGQMGRSVDAAPFEVVTRLARAADEFGFDFVCSQDHVVSPREWVDEGAGATWFDPFVVLTAAAAVTTRIRLVTDVLVLPYRSPFVVAKAGASLDAISNGRFVLGCGSGYLEREFQILGADFEARGTRSDDAIEAIKAAWTDDWLGGDFTVSPKPVQKPRPPIWVGGNSARALRRAIEHADGWTPFRSNPKTIADMLEQVSIEPGRAFDVCVPFRNVDLGDKRAVQDHVAELEEAGVTHCKVGFEGSLDEQVQAMERFASSAAL